MDYINPTMANPFHDHFSGVAKSYADHRPHYPAALFDFLATQVPATATVWDCACGNGQATVDLARRFAKVIGTDASAEQIAAATRRDNIDYRVATAEQSGLPDHSVHLITVAQAAHWFNFDRFYAEVHRVLVPGGLLALWAYGINTVEDDAINAVVMDYYTNIVGPYWPPERILVEQGYQTIPFPFVEIATPTFHMEAHWDLAALLGYFSTWSATNRYIKAKGHNPLEKLTADLKPVWGDHARTRRILWPLTLRLGRVA
jgi:SAM-dependent methyltransferase